MIKVLPFATSFTKVVSLLVGLWLGGVWTFLTPLVVFVGLPVMDRLVGHDLADTAAEGVRGWLFDVMVRLWVPVELGVLALALWSVSTVTWSPVELLGLVISTALVTSGGAINAAHALMHRKSALDRGLAEILMTTATYTHFCIEHVHGHHRHVATPADPASARPGETVWAFLPRTLEGGLRSAIRIERERNSRRGLGWFTWRNRLTRYALLVVGSWAAVMLAFGWRGLAFHAVQSLGAVLLLEVINYVEHYGLQRNEVAPGRYERVQPRHSWNANDRVSNWWLYNLQRHADHHAHASRPYYNLRAVEEGPQLPFSYPTMVLIALVPPLWRWVMDPVLAEHQIAPAPAK